VEYGRAESEAERVYRHGSGNLNGCT
jgi:hypothetical protein